MDSDKEKQKRIEQLEKENLALEELNDLSEMRKRVMNEIGLKERLNIELNKVEKLQEKRRLYNEKISRQIEKIQSKCKHTNVERWIDYHDGVQTECRECKKGGVGL